MRNVNNQSPRVRRSIADFDLQILSKVGQITNRTIIPSVIDMATPEALVKYYECLKDSFNKIQDKNNETALINAALRPKICEEFAKSREVLTSYLSYIQVFSVIYSDKFKSICSEIIVPLFKENVIEHNNNVSESPRKEDSSLKASKLHETIKAIIEDKSNLTNDFVLCVIKSFPTISVKDTDSEGTFNTYLMNSLEVCTYLEGEPLNFLITKILEKITPVCFLDDSEDTPKIRSVSKESHELINNFMDQLEPPKFKNISRSILACFTQEFMCPPWNDHLNYLILYICSSGQDMVDYLMDLLQTVFKDGHRPIDERMASIIFSSSLFARSKFIDTEKVLNYIESMNSLCESFLEKLEDKKPINDGISENVDAFRALAISIFYLITQRYREMYEKDTIDRLVKLNLDRLIHNPYKPLDFVDRELRQRFNEVAVLYHLAKPYETKLDPNKRRKSELVSSIRLSSSSPFEESPRIIPERLRPHFLHYYHHRNFTIIRE